MKSLSQTARDNFLSGYNCAQAVLHAASERIGLDPDLALKLASGFGAGIGRSQQICGAVSGAVMALGVKYGRGTNDTPAQTEIAQAKTRELLTRFESRHTSSVCKQILSGCNLATAEGQEFFKRNELRSKVCAYCVSSAGELLDELL